MIPGAVRQTGGCGDVLRLPCSLPAGDPGLLPRLLPDLLCAQDVPDEEGRRASSATWMPCRTVKLPKLDLIPFWTDGIGRRAEKPITVANMAAPSSFSRESEDGTVADCISATCTAWAGGVPHE